MSLINFTDSDASLAAVRFNIISKRRERKTSPLLANRFNVNADSCRKFVLQLAPDSRVVKLLQLLLSQALIY